jgi:hypothetical protein
MPGKKSFFRRGKKKKILMDFTIEPLKKIYFGDVNKKKPVVMHIFGVFI